jgi:hypothetical protein
LANQITFTDDVLNISTASNADGSIRWHVYEKPHGNGTSIFVQREVNAVLEAEVRLLAEGARPEIFFDAANLEWIFIYNLQENAFMIRYDELEVPTTALPQVGDTAVDHYSTSAGNPNTKTTGQRAQEKVFNRNFQDADNAPPTPDSVAIGAGPTPGTDFRVRFLPHANQQDVNIAGFNIYVKRLSDGGVERANGALVPFTGSLLSVHEAVVPAIAGTYFVTQVNRKGTSAVPTALEEGRKRAPNDFVPGTGLDLDAAITSFMHPFVGEGVVGKITFVQAGVIFFTVPTDTYKDAHIGEGFDLFAEVITTTFPIVLPFPPPDLYKDAHIGEGFKKKILLVGTGGVIIG